MLRYFDATTKKTRGRQAILLICLSLVTAPVWAGPITINFSGTLGSVAASLGGTFSNGQAITGSYTFESTTPARAGSNSSFAVFDALTALSFSIGSYSASSTAGPEIQVDNAPSAPNDRYGVVSRASEGLTGADVGGFALNFFSFRLDDSTNSVFSDALVLPTSISFSDFDNSAFFIFFGDISSPEVISGTITGLSQVPEPSTLLLIASGIAAWRLRQKASVQIQGS